jgi:hypothetical protein
MSEAALDSEFITLAADTLMGDLRDFILDRLKHEHNPLPWNMRSEGDQIDTVARTETAVRTWINRACLLIAANGQRGARGSLIKLQAKDGLQMQINVASSDPLRHELMDHVGGTVMVVIADPEAYNGQRSGVNVTKDQPEMFDDPPEDPGADQAE